MLIFFVFGNFGTWGCKREHGRGLLADCSVDVPGANFSLAALLFAMFWFCPITVELLGLQLVGGGVLIHDWSFLLTIDVFT